MLLFIFLTSDQIKTVWKYFEILLESQVFCGPSIIIFFVLFCGQENVTGEMFLASSGGKRCMVIGKWYRLQWHNDTQRETGGKSGWEKADERPDGVVLPYNKGKLTQHTEASGKCGLWVSCPHTPVFPLASRSSISSLQSYNSSSNCRRCRKSSARCLGKCLWHCFFFGGIVSPVPEFQTTFLYGFFYIFVSAD